MTTPDFAPSSETPDFAWSFKLPEASSRKPGGYVGQAGIADSAGNADNKQGAINIQNLG
jgi:hypothetical protein